MRLSAIGGWLVRRAENIQALMLAVMFFAFIIQVVFRYFFNLPTGWTSELTVIMWLWMVLWGPPLSPVRTKKSGSICCMDRCARGYSVSLSSRPRWC
ncbi:TRAP transporter small permease [Ketogulonicigenium vulgare]|uniref:TRAP transporter small permease n=1 Tax=Ketogulonicigenium vulgare TaxID=92945 RepID=UPI0018D45329|nr:hypothetical protein [Ketogulonicigenium vulgare]